LARFALPPNHQNMLALLWASPIFADFSNCFSYTNTALAAPIVLVVHGRSLLNLPTSTLSSISTSSNSDIATQHFEKPAYLEEFLGIRTQDLHNLGLLTFPIHNVDV
jgi:hypothetical protein